MDFPMTLPVGWVSLYGLGEVSGISGLVPDNTIWRFATIYNIGSAEYGVKQIGDSVMFNEKDVICRLAWDDWPYTIIEEAKLAGIEILPP